LKIGEAKRVLLRYLDSGAEAIIYERYREPASHGITGFKFGRVKTFTSLVDGKPIELGFGKVKGMKETSIVFDRIKSLYILKIEKERLLVDDETLAKFKPEYAVKALDIFSRLILKAVFETSERTIQKIYEKYVELSQQQGFRPFKIRKVYNALHVLKDMGLINFEHTDTFERGRPKFWVEITDNKAVLEALRC